MTAEQTPPANVLSSAQSHLRAKSFEIAFIEASALIKQFPGNEKILSFLDVAAKSLNAQCRSLIKDSDLEKAYDLMVHVAEIQELGPATFKLWIDRAKVDWEANYLVSKLFELDLSLEPNIEARWDAVKDCFDQLDHSERHIQLGFDTLRRHPGNWSIIDALESMIRTQSQLGLEH